MTPGGRDPETMLIAASGDCGYVTFDSRIS
jgi:hypothetical protein